MSRKTLHFDIICKGTVVLISVDANLRNVRPTNILLFAPLDLARKSLRFKKYVNGSLDNPQYCI